MSHYHFITISPLTLPWQDTVKLRRAAREQWDVARIDPALTFFRTGEGAGFIEDNQFADHRACADFAAAGATLLRRDPAYWIRFDGFDRAAFDAFCTSHGVAGTLAAHVVLGGNATVCLVAAYNFPDLNGAAPFTPHDIRALQDEAFFSPAGEAALRTFVQRQVIAPLLRRDAAALGVTRTIATHTVTILIGGDEHACRALARVHAEEEGNGASLVDTLGLGPDTADFVRFGWSFTTIALKGYTKEILFVNLMIQLQNLWFTQRTLREQLAAFNYETEHIRSDRKRAVELEALNIERTFAGNEVDDFRANLKPWLRTAYDYVMQNWGIEGTRENVERMIGDLRTYYERKLDVFENRQSKRQANVLFWIALLQFVAIYEGVGAYFNFLQMSEVDTESWFRSALVASAVIGSPVALTVICVYAAYLYFKDDTPQS